MSATRSKKLVEPVYRMREELGELTPTQLVVVTQILSRFMKSIRSIQHEEYSCKGSARKSICDTCALNPRTDTWPGFAETAYSFLCAVRTPRVFMCHSNQEKWRENLHDLATLQPCEGFMQAITADSHACYDAASRAMGRLRLLLPEMKISE